MNEDKLSVAQKITLYLVLLAIKALKPTQYSHELDKTVDAIKDLVKLSE